MIHPEISKHENSIGAVYGAVPASQPSCTSMPSNQSRRCQYCSTIISLKGPASPLAMFFSIFSFKCGPRLAWQPAGPKLVCEMPLGNLGGNAQSCRFAEHRRGVISCPCGGGEAVKLQNNLTASVGGPPHGMLLAIACANTWKRTGSFASATDFESHRVLHAKLHVTVLKEQIYPN